MKSVVLFIDALTQGGAQRQLVGLAVLLKERGYQVEVVTYHDKPFYESFLDGHQIPHLIIRKPQTLVGLIWRVRKAFRNIHPDVVISYLDSPNTIACLVKMSGMDFRLIVSERNTTQHLKRKDKVRFFLYRWASDVVSNSFSQEQFISHHFPQLRDKTQVITNFVDLDVFRPAPDKEKRDFVRVIGVGRIEHQKNIGCLIKAAKAVSEQGYSVRVDWYGRQTWLLERYRRMIAEMDLGQVFCFHEPTALIHERYQEADLFCLPSLYEGYPNVLCEAMACGLPVICSDVCDNARIMQDGANGFLFDPASPEQLSDRIIGFLSLPVVRREEMGRQSRELAEQRFCKETFISQYIRLMEKLLHS